MKKALISILTVIILFLLQNNSFHYLAFNGIVPDLLLILVCCYGYLRGEGSGIISGFFCGLLVDIFYSGTLGFHSLIYLYIGFFCGLINQLYIEEDIKVPLIMVGLSDILSSFFTYCFRFLLNSEFNLPFYFFNIMLPEIIYTVLMTLPLYPLLKLIDTRVIPFTFRREDRDAV